MARTKTQSKPDVQDTHTQDEGPNAVWFKPLMFGFMLLGLLWIIIFYVSQQQFPVPQIGNWNILVGFGIMFVGFLMTTHWR